MRLITALMIGLVLPLGATACGSTRAAAVPDVKGERLDAAESNLDASGLRYHVVGGGAFGIVVRSHWLVCRQSPRPPATAVSVTLYVERACPAARPPLVPDVLYEELDDAKAELEAAGVQVSEQSDDYSPILVESRWTVCYQWPEGGHRSRTVVLEVSHDCW